MLKMKLPHKISLGQKIPPGNFAHCRCLLERIAISDVIYVPPSHSSLADWMTGWEAETEDWHNRGTALNQNKTIEWNSDSVVLTVNVSASLSVSVSDWSALASHLRSQYHNIIEWSATNRLSLEPIVASDCRQCRDFASLVWSDDVLNPTDWLPLMADVLKALHFETKSVNISSIYHLLDQSIWPSLASDWPK